MPVEARNFRQYDRDQGQGGISLPAGFTGPSAGLLVANRGYMYRVVPSRQMTITNIAWAVTVVATNDDPCDVGIYDAALNKIVTSGATSGKLNTTTGVKSINITATTLQPQNDYYLAFSAGAVGGTAATVGLVATQGILLGQLFGATGGLIEQDAKATMHPLPSAWGAIGGASSSSVYLAAREA